jgi:hypothetical protein
MFLSKDVWHYFCYILSNDFLFVPAQTFFKALTHFQDPSTLIFIATNVHYHSIIAKKDIIGHLLVIGGFTYEIHFVGFIKVFFA